LEVRLACYARSVTADLTVKILQEMRDDIRGLREDNRGIRDDNRGLREDMKAGFDLANARFEVIETSLRDLAQQLVMMSRAITSNRPIGSALREEARGPR